MARKKEVDYFSLFVEAIDFSIILGDMLSDIVKQYSPSFCENSLPEILNVMHKKEHDADTIYTNIVYELNVAFITPIEREDILEIAKSIDDVTDAIEELAFAFNMYDITKMNPDINDFVTLLNKCLMKVREILVEFKTFKKSKTIRKLIDELNELEYEGDNMYRSTVKQLFATEKDPIELQKWRIIYEALETSFDKCQDLGGAVENAIIKNS
ncbi:MAG: DUF47 family protein [Ruminococcaceae bacterium]|nr:DUF47 family protein [Oscillospiraceae bacterium]